MSCDTFVLGGCRVSTHISRSLIGHITGDPEVIKVEPLDRRRARPRGRLEIWRGGENDGLVFGCVEGKRGESYALRDLGLDEFVEFVAEQEPER